ncbi:MAG: NfeD family protein [Firmicutes bacterium HGW-Firmicutes-18]|jgi:membrane protein implicated in regulation of membrane protease activity|nr:MAG: NfeD family protein [Firmicutes bacterium HGW-Firmicutes-18]
MEPASIFWIALIIVFVIIEAATAGITTIWFAIASVIALVAQLLGFSPIGQIAIFLIASAILIYFTRPLVMKYLKVGKTRTNADKLVGDVGKVIEEIDNLNAKGLVKISNQIWTARSLDETIIPMDTLVRVERIDGVKLIVKSNGGY